MIMRTLRPYLARYAALQRNARLFLVSNVLVNVAASAIGLLYQIYLIRLGYATDFLSVLLVVGIAGAGLGLLPAVPLANRYSARKLLIGSDLIGGVAAALQLIAPQPAILVVTTFFIGATVSIFIVLTPPLLAANSTAEERTHLFSLNASLGFLTGVLGALLGGFLPEWLKGTGILRSPLIVTLHPWLVADSILPLQVALILFGLLAIPSLWPLILMDDAVLGERALHVAAAPAMLRGNTRYAALTDTLRRIRIWLRDLPTLLVVGWGRLRRWHGSRYMLYQALIGAGAGLFLTYLNPYFVDHLGLSTGTLGVVSSVGTILLGIVSLLAPILSTRFGAVRGPILAQMSSVPLLIALAFVTNIPLVIVIFLGRSVLMNGGKPALESYMMGSLPAGERGAASSAFNVNWQVAWAIGGVTSGAIIAHFGYRPTFLLAAICYSIGMALLIPWFGKERRASAVPEQREPAAV